VVLVFLACVAYWTALLCRSLNSFSDNRKAAAMKAEFSLALDANTGLCVCPSHVNCYRHSVVPSAVTTTSIRYAWVLRYGAKYVQLHQGTARAALWNETDQHLEGTPVYDHAKPPDGQIRGGLQVMDHNTRWVATNPFPNGAAGSGH